MKVVFVCSGNICRSAMAEAYLRHVLASRGNSTLVESVGTLGIEGAPAADEAVAAMREIGVELVGHRSRGASPERIASADVIVAMTRAHLQEIAARFRPPARHRYVLRAFENGPSPAADAPDLDDPMGECLDVFRAQRGILVRALDHLAAWLERLP